MIIDNNDIYCKPALERMDAFINDLVRQANKFLDRELVWVRIGSTNIWLSLQDLLRDPYIKNDVAFYDLDLLVLHLADCEDNPNTTWPYGGFSYRYGNYNLACFSINSAIEHFKTKSLIR